MIIEHKHCAYALMRITLGMIFLFYGLGKFMMGPTVFADSLVNQFSTTSLPAALVRLFGLMLPFAEVVIGVLVAFGIFTFAGLSLAALLLIGLTFGTIMLQQPAMVAQNLIFALVTFFTFFYLEFNAYAVEHLWQRRTRTASERDLGLGHEPHPMPHG